MNATLLTVPMAQVVLRPQVRTHFDEAAIRELAASIEASGCQYPPLCRKEGDVYVPIDGERRIRAMQLLGNTEVTILVVADPLSIAEALTRALMCNLQRENLNPVEAARGIRQLMEVSGCAAAKVVEKLGYSGASASRWLTMLDQLSEDVLRQVESGEIPASTAYALTRVRDPSLQSELAKDAASGMLSRDALNRKIKRLARQRASGGPPTQAVKRVTAPLGGSHAVTFVGRDLSLNMVAQWLAELLARANGALSRGEDLAVFVGGLRAESAGRKRRKAVSA
jgi:ParB/RepB/Spo0J family partition protein